MSKKQRKSLTAEQKAKKSATDKQRRMAKAMGTYLPKRSAKAAVQSVAQVERVMTSATVEQPKFWPNSAFAGPTEQPAAPAAITEPAQPPAVEPQAQAPADAVQVVTQRGLAEEFTQMVLTTCVASADEAGIARLKVKDIRAKLGLDPKSWRQVTLALEILDKTGKLSWAPGEIKVRRGLGVDA